jgi:hypothetical protein
MANQLVRAHLAYTRVEQASGSALCRISTNVNRQLKKKQFRKGLNAFLLISGMRHECLLLACLLNILLEVVAKAIRQENEIPIFIP